ncbi:hypothetical protein AAFF_G00417960 [Aldrovandia affinis]|uniref:Uncharacterized protein n=1 Tax=Aldrovandia affinis TaxID=143900 RepID=A0AAD7SAL3_9TELE|nr:hypothetical protein AAFF_G00417960 [Aldrovandia affinis]
MASVEANFIKSVLPAKDFFMGEAETSLAVPLEKQIAMSQSHTNDRSSRVQQQVQLTLARKGKRTTSNGSLHCPRNQQLAGNTSTPGSASGFLYNAKMCSSTGHMNGDSWSGERSPGRLTRKEGTKKPSMRVEVSPPSSPQASYLRNATLHYGTSYGGAYTLPKRSPSATGSPNIDRPRAAGLSYRYARSETLHSRRVKAISPRAYIRALDSQPRKLPPPDGFVFSPSGPAFVDNPGRGLLATSSPGTSRSVAASSRTGGPCSGESEGRPAEFSRLHTPPHTQSHTLSRTLSRWSAWRWTVAGSRR